MLPLCQSLVCASVQPPCRWRPQWARLRLYQRLVRLFRSNKHRVESSRESPAKRLCTQTPGLLKRYPAGATAATPAPPVPTAAGPDNNQMGMRTESALPVGSHRDDRTAFTRVTDLVVFISACLVETTFKLHALGTAERCRPARRSGASRAGLAR